MSWHSSTGTLGMNISLNHSISTVHFSDQVKKTDCSAIGKSCLAKSIFMCRCESVNLSPSTAKMERLSNSQQLEQFKKQTCQVLFTHLNVINYKTISHSETVTLSELKLGLEDLQKTLSKHPNPLTVVGNLKAVRNITVI